MAADQYHIVRSFPTKPFDRFACTLEPADSEAGYKIVDFDPDVADSMWLHQLADHFRKPQVVQTTETKEDGTIVEKRAWVHAPSRAHFEGAVRTMERAHLSASGRA